MTLTETAPILAGLAFLGYLLAATGENLRAGWALPAALSVAFLAWSVWAVMAEGPLGFWAIHSGSLWGNQVWFDLLLAAAIGWTLMVPRARAQRMWLVPWALAVAGTGCIGFLAMLARLLYLEGRRATA